MTTARFLIGDVFDVMATLPDQSVDLVLTSPPFLALRSYLPADHPDKAKEIGSEPTPAEFLDTLLALTAEWGRLLAPHGSICVELGDTYAGSGGSGGDYTAGGMKEGQNAFVGSSSLNRKMGKNARVQSDEHAQPIRDMHGKVQGGGPGWPLDKSLCGIPHLYHLSLAYGRNLLTGEPSPAGQWRVRNVVAWCRPNPPVGALGDKFRPATSYMTIATRARDRWFDLDAVRNAEPSPNTHARTAKGVDRRQSTGKSADDERRGGNWSSLATEHMSRGAPPLDWWEVPTEAYRGSHYATWPKRLLERPIKSMCPTQVCTSCGEPRRRMVETQRTKDGELIPVEDLAIRRSDQTGRTANSGGNWRYATERTDVGWTTCDCADPTYRPGVVLDPFGGSGTTGAVATGLGRDCILIDLDERNAELAVERIGMFCTVEDTRQAVAS